MGDDGSLKLVRRPSGTANSRTWTAGLGSTAQNTDRITAAISTGSKPTTARATAQTCAWGRC